MVNPEDGIPELDLTWKELSGALGEKTDDLQLDDEEWPEKQTQPHRPAGALRSVERLKQFPGDASE